MIEKRRQPIAQLSAAKWGASEISLKVELTRDERSVLARARKVDDVKMRRVYRTAPAQEGSENGKC